MAEKLPAWYAAVKEARWPLLTRYEWSKGGWQAYHDKIDGGNAQEYVVKIVVVRGPGSHIAFTTERRREISLISLTPYSAFFRPSMLFHTI